MGCTRINSLCIGLARVGSNPAVVCSLFFFACLRSFGPMARMRRRRPSSPRRSVEYRLWSSATISNAPDASAHVYDLVPRASLTVQNPEDPYRRTPTSGLGTAVPCTGTLNNRSCLYVGPQDARVPRGLHRHDVI